MADSFSKYGYCDDAARIAVLVSCSHCERQTDPTWTDRYGNCEDCYALLNPRPETPDLQWLLGRIAELESMGPCGPLEQAELKALLENIAGRAFCDWCQFM